MSPSPFCVLNVADENFSFVTEKYFYLLMLHENDDDNASATHLPVPVESTNPPTFKIFINIALCRIVFSGINLFKMSNLQFWVKLLVALIITPTLYNLILPATGGCCSQTRHDDMFVSHLYTEQKMFLPEALCKTLLSIPPAFRQVQHIRENVKTDSVECM